MREQTPQTVKDIMNTDVVTVTPQDHIYEIAVKMKQHDIGFIPVVQGKRLLGVVTDRDLVIRGYAEKHPGSTEVKEVMSDQKVITVTSDTTIEDAAKIMARNQIRRLPVVDNNELVGVVAIGDLAVRAALEDEAGEALGEISEQRGQTAIR